jgi:hypothetical protein
VGLLLVGLIVSAAGFSLDAGRFTGFDAMIGVGVAVFGVAVALASAGVYGVAIHHLGAFGFVGSLGLRSVLLIEAAATFLLVADVQSGDRLETGALFVPGSILLAVGLVSLARLPGQSLSTAALVLGGGVGLGSYLLHRYTRFRLGVAAEELEP